ncbi:MAG: hypothetical protein LBT09_01230 [Planctomycetaceae bacterium]|jgi:hypothetical protein|nr:hypothetical protein [Planctomycetaceae bacterium]
MYFCNNNSRLFPLFLILLVLFFICSESYGDGIGDCLWGGANEETAYTVPFVQSGTSLAQTKQPPMNIGAPVPAIPVQATPATRVTLVPQANIPTVSPITGNVGAIGQPATGIINTPQTQITQQTTNNTTGVEILYVIPSESNASEICIEGERGSPAIAATVVAAGTPGAIPVAIKTVTAYRPRVEYKLRFAPMTQKTDTLVRVIDPRTKRVVRTYCRTDERKITNLPVVHWKEITAYEAVTVKIGTPVKQNYPQNYTPNYNTTPSTKHKTLYIDQTENQQYISTEVF